MDDISTREDELAREKQRELEREQERAQRKEKENSGMGIRVILYLIVLAVIIAAVAWLSLNITVKDADPGASLPFTTNYGVSFPEGQTITIGNTHINVLSYQNEIISDIDGEREKLVEGEDRIISERRAVITTLGMITLMDINFQIDLKYKGERDNRAYFDMAVHTSRQVPDILLKQLLPAEIDARPI